MEQEKKKAYKAKKSNHLILSLWFLLLTIFLTLWIFIYNLNLVNENSELDKKIKTKESSISQLEKDPKIVISLIYDSNLSSIKKLENYSNINLFIDHVLKLSRSYGIDFKSFNYSWWKLWLSAISSSDSSGNINYKKVSRFISEYRDNKDNKALFDLNLINSITSKNNWADNIFNISLDLKNNISSIISNINKSVSKNSDEGLTSEEKKKLDFARRKELLLQNR